MSKFRAWKVAELVAAMRGEGDRHIVIPAFQRSFVWNAEQRNALIKSIRSGFPVGSILLYHAGFANDVQRLQLVDGLQRTVTLRKYCDSVFSHLDSMSIQSDYVQRVKIYYPEISDDSIVNAIRSWLVSRKSFEASKGYSNIEFWMYLESSLLPGNSRRDPLPTFLAQLQEVLDSVRLYLDITNYELPVIEFSGSTEDLPQIFDQLNTGGTKLAKYDILAASWNDQHVSITNSELIEAIKGKYRELLSLGLELEAIDNDFEKYDSSYEFLIFEFVFAIGRCLKREFPKLYGAAKEATTEVESIGFTLVTLVAGLRIAQLGHFAAVLLSLPSADQYFQSLREATKFVESELGSIVDFPMGRESLRKTPHSEFQMSALVANVFRLMFDEVTLKPLPTWTRKAAADAGKNLRQWYCYDILRRYWRSAGDAKSYDFVKRSQLSDEVPYGSMRASLDAWFEESLQARTKDLQTASRTVIKLVAGNRLKTMPSEKGRKFAVTQLVSNEDIRGSGITPANPANILLENPDSFRRFDPCGLGGKKPSREHSENLRLYFVERYSALRDRALTTLFGDTSQSELSSGSDLAADQRDGLSVINAV